VELTLPVEAAAGEEVTLDPISAHLPRLAVFLSLVWGWSMFPMGRESTRCCTANPLGRRAALLYSAICFGPLATSLVGLAFRAQLFYSVLIYATVACVCPFVPFLFDVLLFLRPTLGAIFSAPRQSVLGAHKHALAAVERRVLALLAVGLLAILAFWVFWFLYYVPATQGAIYVVDMVQAILLGPVWALIWCIAMACYGSLCLCLQAHAATIDALVNSLQRRSVEPILLYEPPSAAAVRFDAASWTLYSADDLQSRVNLPMRTAHDAKDVGVNVLLAQFQNIRRSVAFSASYWQILLAPFLYVDVAFIAYHLWQFLSGAVAPLNVFCYWMPVALCLMFYPVAVLNEQWAGVLRESNLALLSVFSLEEKRYMLEIFRQSPPVFRVGGVVWRPSHVLLGVFLLYALAIGALALKQ
jgi:hypothetical protein